MAQAVFSVRMDNKIKNNFSKLCDDFGMSMSTAINLFAKTVIREQRIPFNIVSTDMYKNTMNNGLKLIDDIRSDYKNKGGKNMTLKEINKIIYG